MLDIRTHEDLAHRGCLPPLPVRFHHVICSSFYGGKGYTTAFTDTMNTLVRHVNVGGYIQPVMGKDYVCGACPGLHDGLCPTEMMVEMDKNAIKIIRIVKPDHKLRLDRPFAEMPHLVWAIRAARFKYPYIFNKLCSACSKWRKNCAAATEQLFMNAKLFSHISGDALCAPLDLKIYTRNPQLKYPQPFLGLGGRPPL